MIKSILKIKIVFFIKILVIFLTISLKSYAGETNNQNDLIVMGSDKALVTIEIFSSHTCPHCASFHINVVSKIIEKFVEQGQVQLIFVDFPLDQAAFNASKLLHCLDKKKQIKFLDTIYNDQKIWTNGSNINEINENLKKVVKNFGINNAQFDACLINESISDKILNARIDSQKKYSIESTPTIVINEEKLEGSSNFKNIEKIIKKQLKKNV